MKAIKHLDVLLLALALGVSSEAGAVSRPKPPKPTKPQPIPSVNRPLNGVNFSLFFVDPKKAAPTVRLINSLQNLTGVSPCLVKTDTNFSPIVCGNGLVQFGAGELYTYGLPVPNLVKFTGLPRGVNQTLAANFRSPVGLIPGSQAGVVHVHFNQAVTEFGMNINSGQLNAPSIDAVKFVIGTAPNQVTLTPQQLVPGTAQWAGVKLPAGFTDVAIIPLGIASLPGDTTNSLAFKADQFTVVPLVP